MEFEEEDEQLRAELLRRAKLAGTGISQPLDLEKFIAERLQAHGLENPSNASPQIEQRIAELRAEIQERLQTIEDAKPLNLEQLKAEVRRIGQIRE